MPDPTPLSDFHALGIDFAPADVHLAPTLPLSATLGRCERELAAAYLVLTLRHLRKGWDHACTFDELRGAVIVHSVDPQCRWLVGAIAPDFIDLVQHGQAVKVDAERMQLHPAAVAAMRAHVRTNVCSSCGAKSDALFDGDGLCDDCEEDVRLAGDDPA